MSVKNWYNFSQHYPTLLSLGQPTDYLPCTEEQLVIDYMLVHPFKKCTLDLMEELHCEMSSVYRLRATAIEKLLHLRYGAGAGE